jgi:hypothetical protein
MTTLDKRINHKKIFSVSNYFNKHFISKSLSCFLTFDWHKTFFAINKWWCIPVPRTACAQKTIEHDDDRRLMACANFITFFFAISQPKKNGTGLMKRAGADAWTTVGDCIPRPSPSNRRCRPFYGVAMLLVKSMSLELYKSNL